MVRASHGVKKPKHLLWILNEMPTVKALIRTSVTVWIWWLLLDNSTVTMTPWVRQSCCGCIGDYPEVEPRLRFSVTWLVPRRTVARDSSAWVSLHGPIGGQLADLTSVAQTWWECWCFQYLQTLGLPHMCGYKERRAQRSAALLGSVYFNT